MLESKNPAGGVTVRDLRSHYRPAVTKTVCVVLTSKETVSSEKQKAGPGNKPIQIQTTNFSFCFFLLPSKVKFLKERKISLF